MRVVTLRVVALSVVLSAGASAISHARQPTTAIAPITYGQTAPGDVQRAFSDELPRALTTAGFQLMPPNEVDMRVGERPEFLQCRAGGCLAEEAAFLRVGRLALPRLERAPEGGYNVGISLYDSAHKRILCDAVERVGSAGEIRDKLHAMANKLRRDVSRPGRLEVTAHPDAVVSIDGEAKGKTPWSGDLESGDHVVGLEHGGDRVERDVNVAPGTTARVEVSLTAVAPTPSGERSPVLTPLKWAALSVGAVALGVGIGLVVIDGHGTCSTMAGQRQCPEVYDTQTGGIVAVAGGGALIATSIVLFVLDRPKR
jgi:hypothetical protein